MIRLLLVFLARVLIKTSRFTYALAERHLDLAWGMLVCNATEDEILVTLNSVLNPAGLQAVVRPVRLPGPGQGTEVNTRPESGGFLQ